MVNIKKKKKTTHTNNTMQTNLCYVANEILKTTERDGERKTKSFHRSVEKVDSEDVQRAEQKTKKEKTRTEVKYNFVRASRKQRQRRK